MAEALGGYDYTFITDLIEDYVCTLCHLALKNPLQIEGCGHTFCKTCFDQMKVHAARNCTEFICPLDRQKIDTSHVFKDKATERRVLNLIVKCPNFGEDCAWTGELRSVMEHETNCQKNNSGTDIANLVVQLKQLASRTNELEAKAGIYEQKLDQKTRTYERKLEEKTKFFEHTLNQKTKAFEYTLNEKTKAFEHTLNEKTKTYERKLEEKDKQLESVNRQMQNFVQQHRRNPTSMIMPNIVQDECNFSVMSATFEWKFNVAKVRYGGHSMSPPFYNKVNRDCFQLHVLFDFHSNFFRIMLHRYRGKYDHSYYPVRITDQFIFEVNIYGINGKHKVLRYSDNSDHDFTIPHYKEGGNGLCKSINDGEINSFTIDGFVHLRCTYH